MLLQLYTSTTTKEQNEASGNGAGDDMFKIVLNCRPLLLERLLI